MGLEGSCLSFSLQARLVACPRTPQPPLPRALTHLHALHQDEAGSPTRQLSASSATESVSSTAPAPKLLQPAGSNPGDRPRSRTPSFTGQEPVGSPRHANPSKPASPFSPQSQQGLSQVGSGAAAAGQAPYPES